MKNNVLFTLALGAVAALSLTSLTSCDLDEKTVNDIVGIVDGVIKCSASAEDVCTQAQQGLTKAINEEGMLSEHIDTNGDYSMALTLNATGINKLFQASSDWTYDAVGLGIPTLQVGGCRKQTTSIISSLGLSAYKGNIDQCIAVEIPLKINKFGINLNLSATFGAPVIAKLDENAGKTDIYLDLSQAQLIDAQYDGSNLGGLASSLITEGIHLALDDYLKAVHLFEIQAWELGDNGIKMFAGAPRVNEAMGTLTFGMYSNIKFAQSGSVEWAYEASFPSDAELGLHIHPDLIRGLLARLMYSHNIETNVDFGAAPDGLATSKFTVTMANMAAEYDQAWLLSHVPNYADFFTFGFRMWSTENVCGYMDLLAGLQIVINDNMFKIKAGNVAAGNADGCMQVVGGVTSLITDTDFFKQLMNKAELTFNFNEIEVKDDKAEGGLRKAKMGSNKFEFKTDGTGISLFLNFL
ncbi:MAG: hypothetical protein IJ268_04870, partial [Proteobacteria bacterium]|nr:hypothetical protein [Pseudomonadota bacterium]